MLVDAHDDEVTGVGASHDVARGVELVEDDLHLPAAGALLHRGVGALGDQPGGLAGLAAAQPLVLADDDDVEVLRQPRAPSSRMSSSRRSPAAPIMPMREILPRSC